MTAWTLTDDGNRTLLAPARGPARWDVAVLRALPVAATPRARRRLAAQVRQDIWRAAAHVRGFVPLVAVDADGTLTAGGCLRAPTGHRPTIRAAIAALLDNPRNRTRWLRFAVRPPHDGE